MNLAGRLGLGGTTMISIKTMLNKHIPQLNAERFAGHSGSALPAPAGG